MMNKLFCAIAALFVAATAGAQENFPTKPVRILVPFSVGGASDIMARLVGPRVTELWGQQVLVENRPGADGRIAMELAAKSPPDGYTLLIVDPSYAIVPNLFSTLPFDTKRDFVPVVMLGRAPQVLVVHPSFPGKTVQELIAIAKKRPGELNFASAGNGSAGHLAGELLRSLTGIQFTHVPYKGAGPVVADMVAGQASFAFVSVASALSNVKGGRLRALAVSTPERFAALPDTPSLEESGVKGYDANQWWGIVAPAGTPRALVQRMNETFIKAVSSTEAKEKIAALGAEVFTTTPEGCGSFLASETVKWGKIVRDAGTKAE